MKKSIGDNMIPKEWDFVRGLELVKRAGYDGIELWLGDRPWFTMTTTDAEIRALRRKIEDAGLVVSNVSTGLHWASPLSARDPKVRAQGMRIVEREIETAQLLGTDAVLVVAGLVTEEVPYNEVYARCVDALTTLGTTASRAGVKIGIENCNSEQRFLLSPREFALFLDDVASPAVGIHLDVGNIHDTGFAEQWIEMHGPRITRIHLKDVLKHRGRSGDQSVYTNLFLGDNDWPAIRAAITKVKYDGWLIAEMEARYRWPRSAAPRGLPYVEYSWPSAGSVRDFSTIVPLGTWTRDDEIIARVDGCPVALRRPTGSGALVFLGSPLGPTLRAGDAAAGRWLAGVAAKRH